MNLLYDSPNDPQIEKDIFAYEKACEAFENKYRGKEDFLKDERKVLAVLKDYEQLFGMSKPRAFSTIGRNSMALTRRPSGILIWLPAGSPKPATELFFLNWRSAKFLRLIKPNFCNLKF